MKALAEKGLLTREFSVDPMAEPSSDNQLRLKELEVEMRRLELREKELVHEKEVKDKQLDFEFWKMVLEKELQLKELESRRNSMPRGSSPENGGFDLNK